MLHTWLFIHKMGINWMLLSFTIIYYRIIILLLSFRTAELLDSVLAYVVPFWEFSPGSFGCMKVRYCYMILKSWGWIISMLWLRRWQKSTSTLKELIELIFLYFTLVQAFHLSSVWHFIIWLDSMTWWIILWKREWIFISSDPNF